MDPVRKLQKEFVTVLPDKDYDDLYALVKRKKRHVEKFDQDTEPSTIWIQDGVLYNQLKGSLRIKRLLPAREAEFSEPASGLGKTIDFLMKKYNLPLTVAMRVGISYHAMNNIPKSMEVPIQILERIQFNEFIDEETLLWY